MPSSICIWAHIQDLSLLFFYGGSQFCRRRFTYASNINVIGHCICYGRRGHTYKVFENYPAPNIPTKHPKPIHTLSDVMYNIRHLINISSLAYAVLASASVIMSAPEAWQIAQLHPACRKCMTQWAISDTFGIYSPRTCTDAVATSHANVNM